MEPAAASKFCLKSKNMSKPTLHSKELLCGDCGAPPFIDLDEEFDSDNAPAPTLGYRPAMVDGAPHRPAPTPTPTSAAASVTLVPQAQFSQPLSLQLAVKKAAQPNHFRTTKGKKRQSTLVVDPMHADDLEKRAEAAVAKAVKDRDDLRDFFSSKEVLHFQTMVARINWSAEGEPIYQVFGTPVKQVNLEDRYMDYTEFIQRLCEGAKVGDRGIVADGEEGVWQVSMNHLTAKNAVEVNPEEWTQREFLQEQINRNAWPAIAHKPTYHATLVWWPTRGKGKGKGKRTHSRTLTVSDINQGKAQERASSRARSVAPAEEEEEEEDVVVDLRDKMTEYAAMATTTPAAAAAAAEKEEARVTSRSGRAVNAPKRYS